MIETRKAKVTVLLTMIIALTNSFVLKLNQKSILKSFHLSNGRKPLGGTCFFSSISSDDDLRTIKESLLLSSSSSSPRLSIFQKILHECGLSSSESCQIAQDLEAPSSTYIPELNPLLYPLAQSQSSKGKYICSLRKMSFNDPNDSINELMLPIVEAGINSPGVRLLALNGEHLMRRLVAEADYLQKDNANELISCYNEGLTGSSVNGLDVPYEAGSVEKLGYGFEKYALLRIGPFPDLYQHMSYTHKDEKSSLIAAEASNAKFVNFGSTFLSQAQLLNTYEHRAEECRDVARICLRLPLYTIGLTVTDYTAVAKLAQISTKVDTDREAMLKLRHMYEKIREHEIESDNAGDNPAAKSDKTEEQLAMDEIKYLMDLTSLNENGNSDWASIRQQMRDIYSSIGNTVMASFVNK